MSSLLQQILHEIERLSPQEQWQVMEHLISQLRGRSDSAMYNSEVRVKDQGLERTISEVELSEIERLLQETSGIWGNMSREEIDAKLECQRQFDWGE